MRVTEHGILARMGSGSAERWMWMGANEWCGRFLRAGMLSALLVGLAGGAGLRAQTGSASAPKQDAPYVLHVYEDLVQVPALVLNSAHESDRGLRTKDFSIQLDGGPKFHPRQARPEGDDPILLSILLDARRGEHQDLVRGLTAAIARLPPDLLTARDHLSVFAYDCTLVNSVMDVPAAQGAWQSGVSAALGAAGLHGDPQKKPHCGTPAHLQDAVAAVTSRVGALAGRRVLLVISDGSDWAGKTPVDALRSNANGAGLAIFGIQPELPQRPVLGTNIPSRLLLETAMNDPFGWLCGSTGGLLVGATTRDLNEKLERIVSLVRARYILEFARPRNASVGSHQIDVMVTDTSAVVRTSGVAVAVQDEAQRNDAHTVPKDTNGDPVMGRHP